MTFSILSQCCFNY